MLEVGIKPTHCVVIKPCEQHLKRLDHSVMEEAPIIRHNTLFTYQPFIWWWWCYLLVLSRNDRINLTAARKFTWWWWRHLFVLTWSNWPGIIVLALQQLDKAVTWYNCTGTGECRWELRVNGIFICSDLCTYFEISGIKSVINSWCTHIILREISTYLVNKNGLART